MTDHAALLRAAEDELSSYRHLKADLAAFIRNEAYDLTARIAAAEAAGLPGPGKEPTPWTNETSPAPASAGGSATPKPNAQPHASAAPAAQDSAPTAVGSAA